MKRFEFLVLVIVAVIFFPAVSFTQGPGDKNEPALPDKTKQKQMETERMGSTAMRMMGILPKQMVATNDGGLIVLSGNKLLKYDKDLNLVKEVEIKTDFEFKPDAESMQKIIEKMKEKYGAHNKTMKDQSQDK